MTLRSQLMFATATFGLVAMFGCAMPSSPPVATMLDTATLAASMCGKPISEATNAMPLITGLAPVHYAISSQVPKVQAYFDQGLALLYGFEYEAAYDSFKTAHRLDPDCAMCAWGMAMALGPNINNGDMSRSHADEARERVAAALKSQELTEKDRVLLEALAIRYAKNPPDQAGKVFAENYADALMAASQRWPADDFIAILAAEAAMDVNPWDYWEAGGHTALPWGSRAMTLVETVLKRNPDQPEAIHLYIHLTENSDNPKRAEPYADRLGLLAPNSPHLIHMPSHTYYPLGRFKDSITVNEKAIAIDEGMARDLGGDPAWYGYYFHHARFIMSAAQQVGDRETALRMAAEMERGVPLEKALKSEWAESTLALTLQARSQFQSPVQILALPKPNRRLKIATVAWHAVRAQAYARQENLAAARRELAATAKARKAVTSKDWQNFIQRADEMAQGRVELAAGNYMAATNHFRTAAKHDGEFDYSEPPLWDQPAETALGRALLLSGDAAGARTAFDRALAVRPGNAYALWGRAQAEAKLGEAAASQTTLSGFDMIWLGDKAGISLDRL